MPKTQHQPSPKLTSKNQLRPLSSCLITGGAGFLGKNIARALLDQGCSVRIFDRVAPSPALPGVEVITADIADRAALNEACAGIDCVFHTAAIIELGGGRAATSAYRQRSIDVNITGTENVVAACLKQGVQRLVYTSSNAVCFNGTPVTGLNSDSPYAHKVYDLYTESKIAAEKCVLGANGQGLLSCAIRPSGIYGPDSNIMLDKLVANLIAGKLVVAIGSRNAVHENVYIDNLVQAQLLAAERLVEGNRCCGRGYFIADNLAQNYFEFFRPLIEALGHSFPRYWIPMPVLMPVMQLWQWLHFKLGLPEPAMTPKELDKLSTTHLSDFNEPLHDLDYAPKISVAEAMQRCIPYCQSLYQQLKTAEQSPGKQTEKPST